MCDVGLRNLEIGGLRNLEIGDLGVVSVRPEMVDFGFWHLCGVAFRRRRKARANFQTQA